MWPFNSHLLSDVTYTHARPSMLSVTRTVMDGRSIEALERAEAHSYWDLLNKVPSRCSRGQTSRSKDRDISTSLQKIPNLGIYFPCQAQPTGRTLPLGPRREPTMNVPYPVLTVARSRLLVAALALISAVAALQQAVVIPILPRLVVAFDSPSRQSPGH